MDAIDAGTAKLRDLSLIALLVLYLLPLVVTVPTNANVVLTASATVFSGCLRTLGQTHEAEILTQKEAMRYPVVGSAMLVGLFVAIKLLPPHLLSYVITTYFCLAAVAAIGELLYSTFHLRFPSSLKSKHIGVKQLRIPYIMSEPEDCMMSVAYMLCCLVGVVASIVYAATRHFLANNALGISYSLEGIAMIQLGSTQTGVMLLWGLFFYDVFWVFFTPVMVTVATKIQGPIKLLFPSSVTPGKFNMLGLGDIVIPGLFIAMMLHFDVKHGTGKQYFSAAMAGYVAALVTTITIMNVFEAAQPALLYIVPALCLAVFGLAAVRGDVRALWTFSEEADRKAAAEMQGKAAEIQDKAKDSGDDGAAVDDEDMPAELRTFDAGTSAPGFQVVGELKKRT